VSAVTSPPSNPAAVAAPRTPPGDWPDEDLEAVPACPVCGGNDRRVMRDGLRDRVFGAAPGTWRLIRCMGCRSAYLDPRPTTGSIGRAYEEYYTHGQHAPAPPPGLLGRLRRGLSNDYLRARWGYDVRPVTPGGRLIARLTPLRAASVDREIRHLPARAGGRLLDVGSGDGAFLAQMGELGWQAEGLEPDPAAAESARRSGLRVTQGLLSGLDDAAHAGAFDAVTLSHVIEHVHDPAGELAHIHRLLKPGGLLWIATPNLEALGYRRFGRDWLPLDPPRHLVLFTTASLDRLLRDSGFEPLPTPLPSPLASLSFAQSGAVRDGRHFSAGPAAGRRRLRLLATVANAAAALNPRLADELVAVAHRPA
jgi:SAM-dependent methyltransferase